MNRENDFDRQVTDTLTVQLAAWERALETPIVPGELVGWLAAIQEGTVAIGPLLKDRIQQEHPRLFDEIESQDMELACRIERHREEDTAILHDFTRIEHHLAELTSLAANIEPREDRLLKHVGEFGQKGIALILRVRKQEVAIENWLIEAFFRDRGVRD